MVSNMRKILPADASPSRVSRTIRCPQRQSSSPSHPEPLQISRNLANPWPSTESSFLPKAVTNQSGPSSSSLRPGPKRTCPGRRQDPAIHTSSASFATKDGSFRMLHLGVTETETKEENHDLHVSGPTQMWLGSFHRPLGLRERNSESSHPREPPVQNPTTRGQLPSPKKLNAPKVFDPGQASTATTPRPSAATKAASQGVKRERERKSASGLCEGVVAGKILDLKPKR